MSMTGHSDKLAHQIDLSAKQVQQRLEIGDNLEVAREIYHDGVFLNKGAASKAGEQLTALGYTTEVVEEDDHVLLEVQKISTVDADSVRKFTQEVFSVMERHGGDYDGWGADVMEGPRTHGAWLPSWLQRLFGRR